MVLEHVMIRIDPDKREDYLAAYAEARPLVLRQSGCHSCQLLPATEDPGRFVLLITWGKQEDHTEGFRKSEDYERWSLLLHPFYDPFPEVSYFAVPQPRAPRQNESNP